MKLKIISRLIIVGFGHAGQTYLDASFKLSKYINEIHVYDPKIDKQYLSKKGRIRGIRIYFFKKKFNNLNTDKQTVFILAVSGKNKLKILKSLNPNLKLIIIEKPPALNKKDYTFITKNFAPNFLYFALHASKGREVAEVKKMLSKVSMKELVGMQINQIFSDPYSENKTKHNTLINSWADSGINALSVISEIFDDKLKNLKFKKEKSRLDTKSIISCLFTTSSHQIRYRVTTSWSLGIDLKLTQIYIPKKKLELTLDHSKQQLFLGFSTQLKYKKSIKIEGNRLQDHYYQILNEAIILSKTKNSQKNMKRISNNFYSVLESLK